MNDQITKKSAPVRLKRRRRNREDVVFYWALMALPILQILIFYFGVNFQSICMAFQTYKSGEYIWDPRPNWAQFMLEVSQSGFWLMVKNSLIVWLSTSLAGTVLAVIFAYYIYRRNWMSNFFKFVLFLPSVLPGIMLVAMYRNFVGEGIPAFMQYLFDTDVVKIFLGSNDGLRLNIITLFTVWVSFGPQVLVYTGAMDQIDPAIMEAGKIDGVSPVQEFFSLILPNIMSTVGTFLTIGIASIFTNQNNLFSFLNFDVIAPTEKNIGYYLFFLINSSRVGTYYCYAAFLGLLFTLIVAPLAFAARKFFDREG